MTTTEDERRMGQFVTIFRFVVRNETYAVNRAALALDAELRKGDAYDHHQTWELAASIVSHSANLSKVFWPPKKRDRECVMRGSVMRQIFEVDDRSPLVDREVRNGFEHLDERVHEWMRAGLGPGTVSVVDQYTGDTDPGDEFADRFVFRWFNFKTSVVGVGSRRIALRPLTQECDRLYVRWRELEGLLPHDEWMRQQTDKSMPIEAEGPADN